MKTPESALRKKIKVHKEWEQSRAVDEVCQWRINSALETQKIDATLGGQAKVSINGFGNAAWSLIYNQNPSEIDCGNDGQGRVQE